MYYTYLKEEPTNHAQISGIVCSTPEKSHQVEGENFYEFKVDVKRLSGKSDILPVTISERTMLGLTLKEGDFVSLTGEYRSYNKLLNEKSKLVLHFFAKEIKLCESEEEKKYFNEVRLTGFICRTPILRTTPFSREICDVLIAVNRPNYHKSDYIPCIFWSRNANFIAKQGISCKVAILGRIQSREYKKEGEDDIKTAYEVSVSRIEILENSAKQLQENNSGNKAIN